MLIASAYERRHMKPEESNESTRFTEETSQKKSTPRKSDKTRIGDMNEESTEMDNLLEYEKDKDIGA